jgi:hypothetical protein
VSTEQEAELATSAWLPRNTSQRLLQRRLGHGLVHRATPGSPPPYSASKPFTSDAAFILGNNWPVDGHDGSRAMDTFMFRAGTTSGWSGSVSHGG